MKHWKVLFVGVGSIAKRHIRNLVFFYGAKTGKSSNRCVPL